MLSSHFELKEFDRKGEMPAACEGILKRLCVEVLEPVREHFGPILITSGYRSPEANAEAHGQPNSEHIYTPAWCAADFFISGLPMRPVFDWMRNNAELPFHQLILEHGANGSSVVHVSINSRMPGTRSVLEGATHNAEPYIKADYVAYNPVSNHEAVQRAANEEQG